MKEALIILGDQLFPLIHYKDCKDLPVFMAEDRELCTHFKYHKHKIAFFLTAMRHYADELKAKDFKVFYHQFSEQTYFERLESFILQKKIQRIKVMEIQDKFFEKKMMSFCRKLEVEIEFLESPMFLCSREEFKRYLFYSPKPFMKTFYERERKRLGILMDKKNKPVGGHWSYDVENRKKAPKELDCQEQAIQQQGQHFEDVRILVEENFPKHPGNLDDFWIPTTRRQALTHLKFFLKNNMKSFGDYQDALTSRAPFLYHSTISPMVNSGLLTPKEVIEHVINAREENPAISLASAEGFIRQVMGWREFVRGIYQNFSEEEEKGNFFDHHRSLTADWYNGTTGIMPVDEAIQKANKYGYCHHIERLMVLSNIMLLCEINPREVHKWFMEMFVDSADWVMGPNVYGMGQFSDGGLFATKPYISGSNYILKMSDYKKGEWALTWDSLFWRFIDKNQKFFAKNPRLSMMVNLWNKMDAEKKKKHMKVASEFLASKTTLHHKHKAS